MAQALRADAERYNIDLAPTMFAMFYVMLPTDGTWSKQRPFILRDDKVLHVLESGLQATRYSNRTINTLRASVRKLNQTLVEMNVPGADN